MTEDQFENKHIYPGQAADPDSWTEEMKGHIAECSQCQRIIEMLNAELKLADSETELVAYRDRIIVAAASDDPSLLVDIVNDGNEERSRKFEALAAIVGRAEDPEFLSALSRMAIDNWLDKEVGKFLSILLSRLPLHIQAGVLLVKAGGSLQLIYSKLLSDARIADSDQIRSLTFLPASTLTLNVAHASAGKETESVEGDETPEGISPTVEISYLGDNVFNVSVHLLTMRQDLAGTNVPIEIDLPDGSITVMVALESDARGTVEGSSIVQISVGKANLNND